MNESQEMEKQSPPKWRLLRALCLLGHPKIKPLACWLFFIPQFLIYLYLLGPVFVYYTKGVPPKESLEVITGIWREEGELGSNRNGLIAPNFFVNTVSGPRKVHCGFPMQKRLCHGLRQNDDVKVYYDNYFGILAFEARSISKEGVPIYYEVSYRKGVFLYAQPKDTIFKNYGAHQMLALILITYCVMVFLCGKAQRKHPQKTDNIRKF